jgi:hypothetical protein
MSRFYAVLIHSTWYFKGGRGYNFNIFHLSLRQARKLDPVNGLEIARD